MGLASAIFAAVGLLLFFLPVLSIPLGGAGLAFGLGSLALALFGGRASLRWSVAGIAISTVALAVAVGIALAPTDYLPVHPLPLDTQSVPEPHYIPPPALPAE
jgi:hypothetical protein